MGKKTIVVWLLLILLACGTLLFIGFSMNKSHEPYESLESDIKEACIQYFESNEMELSNKESIKVKLETLKEEKFIEETKVKDDECDGYVMVKKDNNKYEYTPYIKCNNYETTDYYNN